MTHTSLLEPIGPTPREHLLSVLVEAKWDSILHAMETATTRFRDNAACLRTEHPDAAGHLKQIIEAFERQADNCDASIHELREALDLTPSIDEDAET